MKRLLAIMMIVVMAGLLGGCNEPRTSQTDKNVAYEVTDVQGTVVKLAQKPQRIATLTLGTDEILVGLVEPKRIAALTYLADVPAISNITEQAKQVPKKIKANVESVIALQPDLLIVADWQSPELIQTIRGAGIPVYVYRTPSTVDEVKVVISQLAKVVGEEEKGQEIIGHMDKRLALVAEKLKQVPADKKLTVIHYSLMGGSDGVGSLFDDVCQKATVVNGAAKVGLGKNDIMSKEQIVQSNPDIFIMPMWDYSGKADVNTFKADIQNDPAFRSVSAIQQQKLVMITDAHLGASSQYVVEAIYDVATIAYPEYMNQ